MELVNCCLQPLVASIEVSCVEADGKEVGNLVSADLCIRGRGFQAERFVRPPVHITLGFSLPVRVHCLVLWPDVRDEEECRVEVSVSGDQTRTGNSSWPCQKFCGCFVVRGSQSCLLLSNRQLQSLPVPDKVLGSHVMSKLARQKIASLPLKSNDILTNKTVHIFISVTRVSSPRPLCIKWLEVWGLPSHVCSNNQRKLFDRMRCMYSNESSISVQPSLATHRLYGADGASATLEQADSVVKETSSDPSCVLLRSESVNNGVVGDSVVVSSVCHRGVQTRVQCYTNQLRESSDHVCTDFADHTPAQFLDEITCELMTVPMMLPSGHCVDKSTLDRTQHADLLYGRPPSDPFTGVPFSEHHRAKFCPQLKVEIDQYCSKHEACSATVKSGRSVGSAEDITRHLEQRGNQSSVSHN